MKVINKAAQVVSDLIDFMFILFFLLVMALGIYMVYDIHMVYKAADNDALLKFKPGNERHEEEDKRPLDAYVAWLSVEGTSIEFPVMQGSDNDEFLNKNPFGEYSLAGSIFLDCRNDARFGNEYSILYGHHMSGDAMFGKLDAYLDEGYLETHAYGTLTETDGTEHPFRLFAVVDSDATEPVIFELGYAGNEDIRKYARKHAIYYIDVPETGRLVALTTCKFPNTTQRTVLLGVFT